MTYYRTVRTKLLWIVLLGAVMASCAGDGGEIAERAYANDVLVDTEWIEAHMEDPSVRVLEVGRNANAFGEGHLPGASFLSMGRLSDPDDPIRGQIATAVQVSAALSGVAVERDQTVVLYDRRNNLSAARAYWVLKYFQHADVRIYNGGTPKWTGDGRALSTVMVEYEPSDYEAGPADPEIRTTWQYVVDHTDDPSTLFCDTRGPEEYLGRDVRAERGGPHPRGDQRGVDGGGQFGWDLQVLRGTGGLVRRGRLHPRQADHHLLSSGRSRCSHMVRP